ETVAPSSVRPLNCGAAYGLKLCAACWPSFAGSSRAAVLLRPYRTVLTKSTVPAVSAATVRARRDMARMVRLLGGDRAVEPAGERGDQRRAGDQVVDLQELVGGVHVA